MTLTAGFFLGAHPVTQAQWKAVMGTEPSHFQGPNRPVEQVSWDDAQEFCAALTARVGGRGTVRLPTETEWEWACRAGTATHFHFGDVPNSDVVNYDGTDSWNNSPRGVERLETTDVGSFPPNPWGLFDLHGNVCEWCADAYAPYAGCCWADPFIDHEQSGDIYRITRGGSWVSLPRRCRAASRYRLAPAYRGINVGFRVAFRLD